LGTWESTELVSPVPLFLDNSNTSIMGAWSFQSNSLNRLTTGTSVAPPSSGILPSGGLNLCWAYDDFGNRTAQSAQPTACPTPLAPTASLMEGPAQRFDVPIRAFSTSA
jgi:hypothetical protein